MRINFEHLPHPRIAERKKAGPPTTAAEHVGVNGRVALGLTTVVGTTRVKTDPEHPNPLTDRSGYRPRCRRSASSMSSMIAFGTTPSRSPTRSTAIDRICSACAFESRSSPVSAAGSRTWNG